jgi:hypothetical protein
MIVGWIVKRRIVMTTRPPVLVGVFSDHRQAEQAVKKLHGSGFINGQMSYMGAYAHGGFLEGLQRAIAGGPDAIDVAGQLVDLGLPTEQAERYAREHAAGHSILALEPGMRAQEAQDILQSSGALDYTHVPVTATAASEAQSDNVQAPASDRKPGEAVRPEGVEATHNEHQQPPQGRLL